MAEETADRQRFVAAIGTAAVHIWGELPPDVQRKIFEHAVVIGHHGEGDEAMRETLANFLHDNHIRTQQAQEANA